MPRTTSDSKKCVVLIIEDDQHDVLLLQRALRAISADFAFQVETLVRPNGMEGLSAVALQDVLSNLPDVVVVDLNMPVMAGESFLRLLRNELALETLPAVVLTTSHEKTVHDAALAAGADRIFVKPNTVAELEAIARQIVSIALARRTAGATQ